MPELPDGVVASAKRHLPYAHIRDLAAALEAAAPALRAQGAAAERDRWEPLLAEALHLLMYGECAPGGTEMWGVWAQKTEAFLRADLLAGDAP